MYCLVPVAIVIGTKYFKRVLYNTVECRYNAVQYNMIWIVAAKDAEYKSEFCDDFGENWQRYNGTVLY